MLDGIGNCGLDCIFSDYQCYNLEIGTYDTEMTGSYSYKHEDCGEDEVVNFVFETIGEWEVVDNSGYSNMYKTRIDEESVMIKIIDIEIILL